VLPRPPAISVADHGDVTWMLFAGELFRQLRLVDAIRQVAHLTAEHPTSKLHGCQPYLLPLACRPNSPPTSAAQRWQWTPRISSLVFNRPYIGRRGRAEPTVGTVAEDLTYGTVGYSGGNKCPNRRTRRSAPPAPPSRTWRGRACARSR